MQSHKNSGPVAFLTVVLVLGIFLSSCAPIGPNFVKPEIDTSADWYEQEVQGLATTLPQLGQWWLVFQDPVLDGLVETARRNNNTLEIAGLRVLEARAQLGIAVGRQTTLASPPVTGNIILD